MKPGRTARMLVMGGACALTGITSLLALIALNGGGAVNLGRVAVTPIAAGYDRWAQGRLEDSHEPLATIRGDAQRASRAAIHQYPYDTGAWLRLAYLDGLDTDQLTPSGVSALQRSYDLVAADPDFGSWRVAFALEHSRALPQPLRASVRQEVDTLWRAGRDRQTLLNLRTQLHNPAGRLSLFLWINRLQANSAK
jgi:hypothetical protein